MTINISDRHMRMAAGLEAAERATSISVSITIAPEWAASPAGQLLATCLVNLLCRMADLVDEIVIDSADYPLLVRVPGVHQPSTLLEALERLVAWAVGKKVTVIVGSTKSDIRLGVGGGAAVDEVDFVGFGRGWDAWVGVPAQAPSVASSASSNPLGPFLAAALLAGEAFKRARGVTRGRPVENFSYSTWTGDPPDWTGDNASPELAGTSLSPFYLMGAGAVGQALGYIIGSAGFVDGYVVVLDDDVHDDTNLNRCFLAGLGDMNDPKVAVMERFFTGAPVVVFARRATVKGYVSSPRRGLSGDLAASEARLEFGTVASCVDKGASRRDIQGLRPNLIVGGSTSGMTAKTNVYEDAPGALCLACHNPAEEDAERVHSLERQLRAMTFEEKRAFLKGKVPDVDAVIASLDEPGCGSVGEQMLRTHATAQPREFSVSFVSMAAGVLQAATLFRRLVFGNSDGMPMTSLSFLNGRIEGAVIAPEQDCRFCKSRNRGPASQIFN